METMLHGKAVKSLSTGTSWKGKFTDRSRIDHAHFLFDFLGKMPLGPAHLPPTKANLRRYYRRPITRSLIT